MKLASAVLCSFHAMEKPLQHSTRYKAFTPDEAASILSAVEEDDPRICSVPPVKPKGGDVFLYSTHGTTAVRGIVCKLAWLFVVLHHPAHSYNYTQCKSSKKLHTNSTGLSLLVLQMTGGVTNTDGCTMESHGFPGNTPWCENFTFPLTHQKEARMTL